MASAPQEPLLAIPGSLHAWNKDRSMIAVCPNNTDIHVYKTNGSDDYTKWELSDVLEQHDAYVSAIDWAPKTDRILSCSHDRNAYVWVKENNVWKPTLVLLRINRAAICCKWSADENKFAVGSGAKLLCICYFEPENNWWVAKTIKGFKSTVTCVSWHPTNNSVLAAGSTDFKCRLISAYVKNVDGKDNTKAEFGTIMSEFTTKGWVHDVAFSPSGNLLGYVAHDSTVAVINTANSDTANVLHQGLPFKSMLFLSENVLVAVGYDYSPYAFGKKSDQWEAYGKCEQIQSASAAQTPRANFQTKALKANDVGIFTKHTYPITCIQPYSGSNGKVDKFSTCASDYKVLVWNMADVKKIIPSLPF